MSNMQTSGPFVKNRDANPVLEACAETSFTCPIRGEVHWEAKDVFNPAAVVRHGKVHLLYRAEDKVGRYAGTSRIGLATSDDGYRFSREVAPVFYPDNDHMHIFEWEGGCEDPRVVEDADGRYWMTYTAFDGKVARLCIASSSDLRNWTKHGPLFQHVFNGKYGDLWSKAGSIVCRQEGDKLIAAQINGQYWMYWGESNIYVATSPDLIHWTPLEGRPAGEHARGHNERRDEASLMPVLQPRAGFFDSHLIEPGPPAVMTNEGIVLIYNSANSGVTGDPGIPAGTYCPAMAWFAPDDPTTLLKRTQRPFLIPDQPYEIVGQVGNVCFVEGLVYFKNQWLLYYGTADSKIAVAQARALY